VIAREIRSFLHCRYIGGDGSIGSVTSNDETAFENVPSTTLPFVTNSMIAANWDGVNASVALKPSEIITDPVSILIIPQKLKGTWLRTNPQNDLSTDSASANAKDCAFRSEFPQESRLILATALPSLGLVMGLTGSIYTTFPTARGAPGRAAHPVLGCDGDGIAELLGVALGIKLADGEGEGVGVMLGIALRVGFGEGEMRRHRSLGQPVEDTVVQTSRELQHFRR
jgi:hypothetical protein